MPESADNSDAVQLRDRTCGRAWGVYKRACKEADRLCQAACDEADRVRDEARRVRSAACARAWQIYNERLRVAGALDVAEALTRTPQEKPAAADDGS